MYGNQDGFTPRSFAPVNIGDEVEVTIEAVGDRGDGIAKIKGFVLFIPNTKEGDTVKVRITKVLRKVGFAEVIGEGSAPSEEAGEEAEEAEIGATEEAAEEPTEEGEEAPAEEATEEQEEAPAEKEKKEEKTPEDTEDFGEDEEKDK